MTVHPVRPCPSVTPPLLESHSHQTVLLQEAVDALCTLPHGIYVDATFGRGGHSRRILEVLGADGRVIAFDRDPEAVRMGHTIRDARFEIIHAPFSELKAQLAQRGVTQIQGLLADLGVSSPQLDNAERGFSFRLDGPLDMRMDPTRGIPVSTWLAQATTDDLRKVISDYGEERFAVPIANAITARCAAAQRGEAEPLESTAALAQLVAETLRRRGARPEPGQHPATRTFQALRIYINHETEELAALLQAAVELVYESGRIAIISFHSLEDRAVKQFFRQHAGKVTAARSRGVSRGQHALAQSFEPRLEGMETAPAVRLVSRIRPSALEIARNPRARSATLRVVERQSRESSPR